MCVYTQQAFFSRKNHKTLQIIEPLDVVSVSAFSPMISTESKYVSWLSLRRLDEAHAYQDYVILEDDCGGVNLILFQSLGSEARNPLNLVHGEMLDDVIPNYTKITNYILLDAKNQLVIPQEPNYFISQLSTWSTVACTWESLISDTSSDSEHASM